MFKILTLLISGLVLLSACKKGGRGSPAPPVIQPGNTFNPNNFNVTISEEKCTSPGPFGPASLWSEILIRDIAYGDASCVKRDIIQGKIDVNTPLKEFGQSQPTLPIWMALRDSSLLHTKKLHFGVIKVLTDAGARLDVKNSSEQSPLHYSLENNHVFTKYPTVAAYLIQSKKADYQSYNKLGETAFHIALRKKSLPHIKLFVTQKLELNQLTQFGKKSLLYAFEADNDEETILFLLEKSAIDFQIEDEKANTALHLAIAKKQENVIRALIVDKNFNIDQANSSLETPLFLALKLGLIPTVNLLLERAANLNWQETSTGENYLMIALRSLEADGQGIYSDEKSRLIKNLLMLTKNLDYKASQQGDTALHIADDVDEVNILLTSQTSVKALNKAQQTPKQKKEVELSLLGSEITLQLEKLQELEGQLAELKKQVPPKNSQIKQMENSLAQAKALKLQLEKKEAAFQQIIQILQSVGG